MSTPGFSVAYRSVGIVDVVIPKQTAVAGYRLKASTQFDGTPAFVTLLTASIGAGYLDPAVNRMKLHTMPGTDHVRAVFNPQTFNGTAGITDSAPFWLRYTPVDSSNVEGADGVPTLVLAPAQLQGTGRVVIAGTAPAAATVAGSLELCLGRRVTNMVIQNTGAVPLFVAFATGGAEVSIAAAASYSFVQSAQSTLLVRGSGGTTDFSASFTVAQGTY